mgnify:CR=1 FL=1
MMYKRRLETHNSRIISGILLAGEILLFITLIMISLFPMLWGALSSFKATNVLFSFPPKFIFKPTLEHYSTVLRSGYFRVFLTTVLYCAASVILGSVLALLAGYSFQRSKFRFKKILFFLVVAGIPLSIGSSALLIPNYLYFTNLGITNKWYTLIILFVGYTLPMGIWIVKGGIEGIPIEIEEAAKIDGCSNAYIIFRIIPILNAPAMAAAMMFIFIGSWNEFIAVMVMVNSPNLRTLQVVIYSFLSFFGQEWGPLTASTTISVIPIFIVFTFLGKLLISGLTQGSVK